MDDRYEWYEQFVERYAKHRADVAKVCVSPSSNDDVRFCIEGRKNRLHKISVISYLSYSMITLKAISPGLISSPVPIVSKAPRPL